MLIIISYIGITFAVIGSLLVVVLFVLFGVNKRKYNQLIDKYHFKGLPLYSPYNFYALVGFFGSFGMVYYFYRLKEKKEPLFMYYNGKDVYDFFDDIPDELSGWLSVYYKTILLSILCMLMIVVMAFIKYIYISFSV